MTKLRSRTVLWIVVGAGVIAAPGMGLVLARVLLGHWPAAQPRVARAAQTDATAPHVVQPLPHAPPDIETRTEAWLRGLPRFRSAKTPDPGAEAKDEPAIEPTEIREAQVLMHKLRAAGLRILSGRHGVDGTFYVVNAAARATFVIHAPGNRIIVAVGFMWISKDEDELRAAMATWDSVNEVLASYLAAGYVVPYSHWVNKEIAAAATALNTLSAVAAERRFGKHVVRVDNIGLFGLGWSTCVEIGRAYRPWHEIMEKPAAQGWGDMCEGLTLAEVEAFAGPGTLKHKIGDTWQYAFANGAWVSFENGRAANWMTP